MPKYLLHGLWLPESGLNLWVEQVEGHRIITMQKVPAGTFPAAAHSLLEEATFRRRANIRLQTPKGKQVSLGAPTAALAPEDAVRFLASLEFLDSPSPAATAAQREAIAPDLYWLIRMYAGLTQFIRAGRVSIHVPKREDQWYAQWQLGTGVAERGWLAEMLAVAPGVLIANNPGLGEDMATTLTHWIASARLRTAGVLEADRTHAPHDFVNSLLTGAPLRRGDAALARRVGQWNGSITAVNLQLVFIVAEPSEATTPPDTELTAQVVSDADRNAATVWPVRIQVRSGTDSPRPVRQFDFDGQTAQKLRQELTRASTITSLVNPAMHPRPTHVPESSEDGDWDVYLTLDEMGDFVTYEASKLRGAGFTVMLPRAWASAETRSKLNVTRQENPYNSSTVTRLGFDTLMQYDWRVSVGGVELTEEEMTELVNSKSGLVKLRGEWVLADKAEIARTAKYMQRLRNREEEDGAVTAGELRQLALESAAESGEVGLPENIEFTGSTWFTSLIDGTDRPAPERVDIPDTVKANLRDYQRRGVDWLYFMSRNNLGAVLADDMGLGKTLQLLTLLAVERNVDKRQSPTLVVAPTSVVGNWAREAGRFVPGMRVLVHHGSRRLHGQELVDACLDADLVVTSYGVANRDVDDLAMVQWDHVVLDEAQAIKNAGTRSSKSVRALPARHRIALTGTPIENKLAELRNLLDFVNPGILGSQTFFRNHFAKAIESQRDVELAEEMGQRLQRLTAPFILRRLKTDPAIIDDLPEKAEHVITVDMTAEQAALYKALVDTMQAELQSREGMARKGLVLSTITRIKQICNHPAHYLGDGSPVTVNGKHRSGKVERLIEILDRAAVSDQRVLIFTQYKAFGDILQPYLSDYLGEDIPFLHGGVGKSGRDAMVQRFQAAGGPPAMLLSLKAGGTGLNLTAASIVVHMDRWWNPAVENQATDRAYRIGQERDVTVYKMITRGTMEESIQDVLDGKMQLAGVVGEGEGWITELNTEDLARLISFRGDHG
ncbi:DEAD/DEAH box helicase [Corynebacterium sp. CNCTC7651]|uniref:DEAD/DEAH box helicase n=1 Tax=Corynebacterium sp. CNCTC7651 TaxID=2815361 RepID=UPI001F16086A|nr:DEAD/DEAH box helicase [Corynebacterium sp. CNCTC7651]UIZ92931.1 DEAD/DEAH box helicase [Corynebacterium sp. CNCTC7651]